MIISVRVENCEFVGGIVIKCTKMQAFRIRCIMLSGALERLGMSAECLSERVASLMGESVYESR